MKLTKSIILAVIISAATVLLGFTVKNSNENESQTVFIQCVLTPYVKNSSLKVYYGSGKIEVITLEKDRAMIDQVVTSLNKLNTEGYEIVSFAETLGNGATWSSYVLKKK